MRTLVLLCFGMCIYASAQTAKVIVLSPEDAKLAWNIARDKQNIEELEKAFNKKIVRTYLVEPLTHDFNNAHPYNDPDKSGIIGTFTITDGAAIVGGGEDTYCYGTTYEHNQYMYPCHASDETKARAMTEADKAVEENREAQKHKLYYKNGWSDDFQFSDDYKYIVPKEQTLKNTNVWCPPVNGNAGWTPTSEGNK